MNMADFSKSIKSRPKEPSHSLEGLVVTPHFQKFHTTENGGFNIKEIVTSEDFRSRFDIDAFPTIEIMSDGTIFFQPVKNVIKTTESYFVKWFALTEDFEVRHDHDYQFATLPENGYLAKFIVTPLEGAEKTFRVEYILPASQIQIEENEYTKAMKALDQSSQNYLDSQQVELRLKSYELERYPKFDELIKDKESFFETYISKEFEEYTSHH